MSQRQIWWTALSLLFFNAIFAPYSIISQGAGVVLLLLGISLVLTAWYLGTSQSNQYS